MNNDIINERIRYEIVLLEDDPKTLELIKNKLESRGITVYDYTDGNKALQKIRDDASIGAFVTDIEIRYPYPNGTRNGLQGYDVANRMLRESPNRLLSVVVLTALEQEEALDSMPVFQMRVHPFSKHKWMKLYAQDEIEKTFDALALLIKEYIELTPYRWFGEVKKLYPKSRWVCKQKDGKKNYPPYWEIYRNMWFSHSWKQIEPDLGARAEEIVRLYLDGEIRKLRGDHLSLTENPTDSTFLEHLIGRRVVYALKALEPAYWESMVRGERPEEEEMDKPTEEAWGKLDEETKSLVNKINQNAANLKGPKQQLDKLQQKAESLENKSSLLNDEEKELENLHEEIRKIHEQINQINNILRPSVNELVDALKKEPSEVQQGFIAFLRYLNADLSKAEWTKKPAQTGGGRDPLTQTLLLLGIRKQDIQDENPENWKLLLPEERKWLRQFLEKYT